MTIKNKDTFFDGIWDWAMFDGCFGETRIKPTDIDGLVERRGKFLVLETKHPGAPIPEGQKITFQHMIETGVFSILILWGEKDDPQKALLMTRKGEYEYDPADKAKCRSIVSDWFQYAEGNFS